MFLAKDKLGYLFLVFIFLFLIPNIVNAIDHPVVLPLKGDITPGVLSQDNKSILELSERGKFQKLGMWSNDTLVAGGPISGGFSADYDENGYLYAARCTTYVDSANAVVSIYKSIDYGHSWFYLTGFGYLNGSQKLSYPYVLIGDNPSKLYVFSITSANNGDLGVARFSKNGDWEGWHNIKVDADTISYFSACTDDGSHLMVAYQKEANGPKIYSIVSTDSGATWVDDRYVDDIGSHPDIAYGREGYVYLTWEKNRVGDSEIWFFKHTNYGLSIGWTGLDSLTANSSEDTYPKIAVLHTVPKDTACVWVVYNHHAPITSKVTDIDLDFAYSTNSGTTWTKEQILANDPNSQELAADLKVYRDSTFYYVDLCYLNYPLLSKNVGPQILYTWSHAAYPDSFNLPHVGINDHWPYWSEDSREVCQVLSTNDYPGIMYVGELLLKDGSADPYDRGWNLYYDHHDWEDVDENQADENFPTQFSLSANYPNPFNPETKIDYSINRSCQVKLEIFNILGQKIKTLVDEHQSVGKKDVVWDGRNENGEQVTSGVYFYRIQAGDYSQTKKMVLMK